MGEIKDQNESIEDKESFLDKLDKVVNARQSKVFSVNQLNRRKTDKKDEPEVNRFKKEYNPADIMDISNIGTGTSPTFGYIADSGMWDDLLNRFDEVSPIEEITLDDRLRYRRKSDGDKYDIMFDKETSMLNELLSDVNARSKIVNNRVKTMTSKGSYGVSKGLTDLIEASNSLDNTKLSTIKAIADLKKTAYDMRLKEAKMNPDSDNENVDSIADQFYKSLIGGSSDQFIQSSMNQYQASDYFNENEDGGFNISSGIPVLDNYDNDTESADKYGYIAHENSNIEVCLHRFSDGTLSFVALDDAGNIIDDYELPDNDLLDSIDIKPMSKYGYDIYQRKYKIIDVNTDMVDISNIDNTDFDNVNNDDKYDY